MRWNIVYAPTTEPDACETNGGTTARTSSKERTRRGGIGRLLVSSCPGIAGSVTECGPEGHVVRAGRKKGIIVRDHASLGGVAKESRHAAPAHRMSPFANAR